MRWFLALPLLRLLFCGAMCLIGALVTVVAGRNVGDLSQDEAIADRQSEGVERT